jgi:acyl-CoA thioesterase
MSEFADLLYESAESISPDRATIRADFLQGRAAFGGLVAALCVRAMRQRIDRERPLRSILVSLIAPVAEGAVEIQSDILREGRAATHARAEVLQQGKTCAAVMGCFAAARNSPLSAAAEPVRPAHRPEELKEVPFIEGLTPRFTKHFEYRWPDDHMPFLGKGKGVMEGWVRLREQVPVSEVFLTALGDAWPTPALPMLTDMAAFSTLTMSLEYSGLCSLQRSDEWWHVRGVVEQAEDGYVHQETRYWTAEGCLVLVNRQIVGVFTKE